MVTISGHTQETPLQTWSSDVNIFAQILLGNRWLPKREDKVTCYVNGFWVLLQTGQVALFLNSLHMHACSHAGLRSRH